MNIWRVHWYSIIIVLEKEKETCQSTSNTSQWRGEQQSSSSSHSKFHFFESFFIFIIKCAFRFDRWVCMCVLTSSLASLWLISIFYFNMVQLHIISSLLFASLTSVAIQSVLNIVFNICQCRRKIEERERESANVDCRQTEKKEKDWRETSMVWSKFRRAEWEEK